MSTDEDYYAEAIVMQVDLSDPTDAALVAAMAELALEDGALIDGAGLTEREAQALWTLEAQGIGKMAS